MRVGQLGKSAEDAPEQGTASTVPVQFKKDLDMRWYPSRTGSPATIKVTDEDFCMLCTYVIEVKNTYVRKDGKYTMVQSKKRKGDTRFRLVVE